MMIKRAASVHRLEVGEYLRQMVRADLMITLGHLPSWKAAPPPAPEVSAEERQS